MKSHLSTIHDILLLHAVVVTIIMSGILHLWTISGTSDQALSYLKQVGCTYEIINTAASAVSKINRECLSR
ncbi:hypothetical protein [Noviherbaspirillum pedocola]|uniref:Uncharacterized protein n=1 Tax=Noviherbaspirillum pedocola TaxID=2801341 RepID=A0A934STL3_9BURK|nr:hypothetical protein [Noviherbaspirillum pedocola]MBK4735427.1 hypothetical protein [Noviherbaspirillum pedocola]